MNDERLWQTKLAARLHDPPEKALVLLRDPEGHEGGTSRELKRLLGLDDLIDSQVLQRADRWAAAADRPQWPNWAQVRWFKEPVLVHPLTGAKYDLGNLAETELTDLKQRSRDHFSRLHNVCGVKDGKPQDYRKTLLAYWRFGPELGLDKENYVSELGVLWTLLPADTRVPDHSIWDHLDLTSAFAGAFAVDPNREAALLALSIGPVQSFIAAARSTSDLWAGSHLLSRLAWEAMRPVCEALGPDAILFPRLRGIPQVDLWLRDQMGLPPSLFEGCDWVCERTDANPLFSATLPNRFVAVVPESQARDIAEQVTEAVRDWLGKLGKKVVKLLLKEAGYDVQTTTTPYEQMKQQLQGFPEVYWAAVPFSLLRCRDYPLQRDLDVSGLLGAMAPFFGVEPGTPCGFLDTPAWQVLQKKIDWGDGTTFFAPNPGVLYPAVYDLADRVMAAAKAARPFAQNVQEGWRDSLTGEAEWLTTDRVQLTLPPGQREETLWTRIAKKRRDWAKEGEHLGALAAIKRLWPTIFAKEVGEALAVGEREFIGRFVVSTHTMALAHQLDQWLKHRGPMAEGTAEKLTTVSAVALPRGLMRRYSENPDLVKYAKHLPGLLEDPARETDDAAALAEAQRQVKQILAPVLGKDEVQLEAYYALLMMDGDNMGRILSGGGKTAITYRDSFHPQVQRGFDQHAAEQSLIKDYGEQLRSISPNRHLAISGALNDFSQVVVRHVVELEYLGQVIYSGGDDVLAMLPVADLLSCMQVLRYAYSGTLPDDESKDWRELRKGRGRLHCKNGFAWLNGRLMRMMGENATASTGAVIAHHQAPLAAVLRELRAAERRAKTEGGRDAFSLTVIKRSGGALYLTAKWGEPLRLLEELVTFLRQDDSSRRAVYNTMQWLKDLPEPRGASDMLRMLLAYQLARQSGDKAKNRATDLAQRLATLAANQPKEGLRWLENFLNVAEFLARDIRAPQPMNQGDEF